MHCIYVTFIREALANKGTRAIVHLSGLNEFQSCQISYISNQIADMKQKAITKPFHLIIQAIDNYRYMIVSKRERTNTYISPSFVEYRSLCTCSDL